MCKTVEKTREQEMEESLARCKTREEKLELALREVLDMLQERSSDTASYSGFSGFFAINQ
jgi:predicted glycosyltransferase